MEIKKKNRKFLVNKLKINHVANLTLKSFEQITLVSKDKSEYDISKTDWGYYATPSINQRLKENNLDTYIVFNKLNKKIFIHLVHKKKALRYKRYLKEENLEIISWPNKIKKYLKNKK